MPCPSVWSQGCSAPPNVSGFSCKAPPGLTFPPLINKSTQQLLILSRRYCMPCCETPLRQFINDQGILLRNTHTKTSPLCCETQNPSFNICVALAAFSAASLNSSPSNAWASQEPSATPLSFHSLILCLPGSDSMHSLSPVSVQTANTPKSPAFVHSHNSHFCGLGQREAQAWREQLLKLQLTEQIRSFFHLIWFKVSCLAYSTRERYWWSSIWWIICTAMAPGIFISVSPMNPPLGIKRHKQDLSKIMRTILIP